MTRLSLTLLGDFQARLEPGPPLRLRTRKTQALLAYLARVPGQPHSRDKLADLLWGERSPDQARSRLRDTLFALRQALKSCDPPCLDAGSEVIALRADTVDVDVLSFEQLVRSGGPAALEEAVRLYRGDFLEGFAFRGAPFEDWLMAEREGLRELALEALAKLLSHQRASGAVEAALATALRLVTLDPLQEAAHRVLMRLYVDFGRRGAALRQYQACVGVLRRELGAEPEADTRRLYQEILRVSQRSGPAVPQAGTGPPPAIGAALTPLIGRAPEMTRLREALLRARDAHGRHEMVVARANDRPVSVEADVAA